MTRPYVWDAFAVAGIAYEYVNRPPVRLPDLFTQIDRLTRRREVRLVYSDSDVSRLWPLGVVFASQLGHELFYAEEVRGVGQSQVDVLQYQLASTRSANAVGLAL